MEYRRIMTRLRSICKHIDVSFACVPRRVWMTPGRNIPRMTECRPEGEQQAKDLVIHGKKSGYPTACCGDEWRAGVWGQQPPFWLFPWKMPRSLLRGSSLRMTLGGRKRDSPLHIISGLPGIVDLPLNRVSRIPECAGSLSLDSWFWKEFNG